MDSYPIIDLDDVRVRLSLKANQRQGFMEIRHCDWLSPKVDHGRRRGRLVDILIDFENVFQKTKW